MTARLAVPTSSKSAWLVCCQAEVPTRDGESSQVLGFFFQAEDGIRVLVRSRGVGDVYERQGPPLHHPATHVLLEGFLPVPYTPLTLPTNLRVYISFSGAYANLKLPSIIPVYLTYLSTQYDQSHSSINS